MAKYINKQDREWKTVDIVGNQIEICELWHDENVSTRIAPMPKGKDLGFHRHDTWVQVYVIQGKLKVKPDNKLIEEGGYFFVEPGDEHSEVAIEDSLVLVIRDEPNKQYPIAEK